MQRWLDLLCVIVHEVEDEDDINKNIQMDM